MESFLPRVTFTDAEDALATYDALMVAYLPTTPGTDQASRLAALVVATYSEYIRLLSSSDSSTESE